MTRREKTIVVLMAGAVAYGAYEVAFGKHRRPSGGSGAEDQELKSFVAAIGDSAGAAPLTAAERRAISLVGTPWPASPFVAGRAAPVQVAGEGPAPRQSAVIYTGFLRVGGERLGILNGREYRVGEKVAGGDYLVKDIRPDSVTLQSPDGGNREVVVRIEVETIKRGTQQ